jgi:glutamine synthetase
MAGLDGIQKKIHPGDPLDKDIYGLSPKELKDVPSTPGSLEEAMRALEADHEFLMKGDVFTQDAIDMWLEYKWNKEINPMRMRPVPYEFVLYFDC